MEIELLLKIASTLARITRAITALLDFIRADDDSDDNDGRGDDSNDCDETDDDNVSSAELEPGGVIIEW